MITQTIGTALRRSSRAAQSSYHSCRFRLLAERIQRTTHPILVGPWRGEVGFEVLYWIPWLHELFDRLKVDPARVYPITRGGAAAWYRAPQGIELYNLRTPQQVRVENRRQRMITGLLKQTDLTPFDGAVCDDVAQSLKFTNYIHLHPREMYRQLSPFWEGRMGTVPLLKQTRYTVPIMTTALPEGLTLPENFVAVKFYARPTFPYSHDTKLFVKACVEHLAAQTPVIVLDTDVHADDHMDFAVKGPNVHRLRDLVPVTPETSLSIQSAVLSRALGFVGTYGGIAQLALLLKKPTVSFYTTWQGTALPHKFLSDELAIRLNLPWHVLPLNQLPLLETVCPMSIRSDVTTQTVPVMG